MSMSARSGREAAKVILDFGDEIFEIPCVWSGDGMDVGEELAGGILFGDEVEAPGWSPRIFGRIEAGEMPEMSVVAVADEKIRSQLVLEDMAPSLYPAKTLEQARARAARPKGP